MSPKLGNFPFKFGPTVNLPPATAGLHCVLTLLKRLPNFVLQFSQILSTL
jgi:hypothetical protein